MAIQFARAEYASRSQGKNACCKSAYNARARILDAQSNVTYTFERLKDNKHHEVILPSYVDKKFKDVCVLSNAVETSEKRKDSQIYKEYVLALPDDDQISIGDRVQLTKRFIQAQGFIDNGLGVQIDIHEPHDGEKNWHAHLLVTTRAFTKDGLGFESKKTTALDPMVRGASHHVVGNKHNYGHTWKEIQNAYFKEKGLDLTVDAISLNPEQHLGPIRMRGILDEATLERQAIKEEGLHLPTSGGELLAHISLRQSYFTKNDLIKYVQNIDDMETRTQLVEEALSHKELVSLHNEQGLKVDCYTTKSVREEEERCMRLSMRILKNTSPIAEGMKASIKKIASQDLVSRHQQKSLEYLLTQNQGLHILEGRAGTGKSHVLGWYKELHEEHYNEEVIGLAPTHKAVDELSSQGYERVHTIKGFLFQYKNNKLDVENGSTLVVDEAGMIDTPTLTELFKVAVQNKCKVILSGDDRQLQSIERGGMFGHLRRNIGSTELSEIRRQRNTWGRDVSHAFSEGDVLRGVEILDKKNKLHFTDHTFEAMNKLLDNWSHSKYALHEQLILTIANNDVNALNRGAREILKQKGYIKGPEIEITNKEGKNRYAEGDRIVFTESNKHEKIKNGEFASITSVFISSRDEDNSLTIQLDNGTERVINPAKTAFKHGYATTVYKSQGASIKDVHVYHSGFSTKENAYVEMSRHVENLNLYCAKSHTKDLHQLTHQLSHRIERGCSLAYKTAQDLAGQGRVKTFFKNMFDTQHQNESYYAYKEEAKADYQVRHVLDKEHTTLAVAGESYVFTSTTKKQTSQQRDNKPLSSWNDDLQKLRHELRFHTESIAHQLLGEPNKSLSTQNTLRFGDKGALAIEIAGPKAGIWHDFSAGEGGDLLALIGRTHQVDFKESVKIAQELIGHREPTKPIESTLKKQVVHQLGEEKQQRLHKLYQNASTVNHTLSATYLRNHRGVSVDNISPDLRHTNRLWHSNEKLPLPALLAFARNEQGDITGAQAIYLNFDGTKSSYSPNKRSMGQIKGSFVEIQKAHTNITLLAEGVETAMSLKEANIPATILCSLGVHNFKHYKPKENEVVVIAADHDKENAATQKALIQAQEALTPKAKEVMLLKPRIVGDYNDVLQKEDGARDIHAQFMAKICDHINSPLFGAWNNPDLNKQELLAIKTPEEVTAYVQAQETKKQAHIKDTLAQHSKHFKNILHFNPKTDIKALEQDLLSLNNPKEAHAFMEQQTLHAFASHIDQNLQGFAKNRAHMNEPQLLDSLEQEQHYLHSLEKLHPEYSHKLDETGRQDLRKQIAKANPAIGLLDAFKHDLNFLKIKGRDDKHQDILEMVSQSPLYSTRNISEQYAIEVIKTEYQQETYHYRSTDGNNRAKFDAMMNQMSAKPEYAFYLEQSDTLKNAINYQKDLYQSLDRNNNERQSQKGFGLER